MSYCITISHLEKETVAHVDIYGLAEESRSVRISQFQCIGWLLSLFDFTKREVEADSIMNPEYEQEALEQFAGLAADEATTLLSLTTLKERFLFVWSILDAGQREIALAMDFDGYDNFWPQFDAYSQLWSAESPTSAAPPFG